MAFMLCLTQSEFQFQFGLTEEEFAKLTLMQQFELRFNWYVTKLMPYYKQEVMQVHNITSDEEYIRRIIEGDESIYLPQPNPHFQPTMWEYRAAQALGLDYQGLQEKIKRGEIEKRIATGYPWRDEDSNAYSERFQWLVSITV